MPEGETRKFVLSIFLISRFWEQYNRKLSQKVKIFVVFGKFHYLAEKFFEMRRVLISVLLILALAVCASAQRTAKGQFYIGADWATTVYPKVMSYHVVNVGVGQYSLFGKWQAGVQYATRDAFGIVSVLARGGAMYRFYGSRSRVVNFYGGGDLMLGADFCSEQISVLVPDGDGTTKTETQEATSGFVWGIDPRLEFEVFPFTKVAFYLGASFPVKFSTQQKMFQIVPYVGIRVNL